ncbi:hypothetical protein MKY41_05890 [Sporosarcina sp. FSL W7-1349]|uniref:hypothetical protein n=1 Tax=Sporosarcina sp. FSL W7-1349 TaxID=2921561 RepID=UPI0030FA2504
MNEVKKSLHAIVGDVSKDKEELKRNIRPPGKPKKKNLFPYVASLVVTAAILFFAFNVYQGNPVNSNKDRYEVNETYYNLMLKTESLGISGEEARYLILMTTLQADAVIDYARSLGFTANADELSEKAQDAKHSFYESMTPEEIEEMERQQLENFGISYDEYFQNINHLTIEYNEALEWIKENPPAEVKTNREVLDAFMEKHEKTIQAFMEDKQIPHSIDPALMYTEIEGLVADIQGEKILIVQGLNKEEIEEKPMEEVIEMGYDSAWFTIGRDASQIEPLQTIKLTYDPLSYPVINTEPNGPGNLRTVLSWEIIEP